MENRNSIITFVVLIIVLAFAFILCNQALTPDEPNSVLYGAMAYIGYLSCLIVAIIVGINVQTDGGAIAIWFFVLAGVAYTLTVWYSTRIGAHVLQIW